jgi:hypothetical protein
MFSKFMLIAAVCVFLAAPVTGQAVTLQVNCDQPKSKLPTIAAALQLLSGPLGNLGPNTIEVSGACKENLAVAGLSDLTLTAKNGASITDASGGTASVINVNRSYNFALNGFAIRGGGGPFKAAIGCFSSTCFLSGNNVQIPGGTGIVAAFASELSLNNDVLEQSQAGLLAIDGSNAILVTTTIRNNAAVGVHVAAGSFLETAFSTIVENNGTHGIWVHDHSSAQISQTTVTRNGGIGVFLQMASEAFFFLTPGTQNTISDNALGVAVQDLSWANLYSPGNAVSGSADQPDIQCWGHFSGATNAAAAGTTNCEP